MEDTLLGADERQHLRIAVDVDTIPALVEARHRMAQLGDTHRDLIAVGIGIMGHLTELFYCLLRRRHIRTAYGEADDIAPRCIQLGHFLQFTTEVVLLYQT